MLISELAAATSLYTIMPIFKAMLGYGSRKASRGVVFRACRPMYPYKSNRKYYGKMHKFVLHGHKKRRVLTKKSQASHHISDMSCQTEAPSTTLDRYDLWLPGIPSAKQVPLLASIRIEVIDNLGN